jgi:acetate---CoA ligase (ADP-forming)
MEGGMNSHAGSGIDYFFNPRSIAIIGASRDFTKPSGRTLAVLLKRGYRGKLFPINPRYREIGGLACYPTILDVPEEIDLVIIGIPASQVIDILRQCAEKKVKAAIIFSSGFSEVGEEGKELQQRITELAKARHIRILGPNCFGLIHTKASVIASFATIVDLEPVYPSALGYVSQSGAYGASSYSQAIEQGVGFSAFVSVGNEADTEFSDYVDYLLDDAETKAIGGYLEGARNGIKFRKVAEKALRMGKPLMIVKAGRSRAGSRAASSHTGSLAGSDEIYDAFFRQMGIIRYESLSELIAFVVAHGAGRMPSGGNIAIVSGSGGSGVMMTDKCESLGLTVPELRAGTRRELAKYLPSFGSGRNPVDLTAQINTDSALLGNCLRVLLNDDGIDMMIARVPISPMTGPAIAKDIVELFHATTKPLLLVIPASYQRQAPDVVAQIKKGGVPVLSDSLLASQAMARLWWYARKHRQFCRTSPLPEPTQQKGADESILSAESLSEFDCKKFLAEYGLPVTRGLLAISAEMAAAHARTIGYPVVLKIQSPQIPHKTESGGIRLNLTSDEAVRAAYAEIIENAGHSMPEAEIQGVLVEEMVKGGVEVIIGTTRDPVFGHVLMFGLGGIFVEAMKDVSFRIAPVTRKDAEEMVREIRGYRVLTGMRGKPSVDLDALVDVLLKVSQLVTGYGPNIRELDINPLVVLEKGARVVDALLVK